MSSANLRVLPTSPASSHLLTSLRWFVKKDSKKPKCGLLIVRTTIILHTYVVDVGEELLVNNEVDTFWLKNSSNIDSKFLLYAKFQSHPRRNMYIRCSCKSFLLLWMAHANSIDYDYVCIQRAAFCVRWWGHLVSCFLSLSCSVFYIRDR